MSQKKSTTTMLPKLEVLIIGVLFIGFIIWSFSKCQQTKTMYEQQATRTNAIGELSPEAKAAAEDAAKKKEEAKKETEAKDKAEVEGGEETEGEEKKKKPRTRTVREPYTPLYVSIEGLNVRMEPKLNADVVAQLKLHEEVTFLNEVTEFKQKINLGTVEAYEPWIKIRTRKNKTGWVYGAGVHYYKTTTAGVQ